MTTRTDGQLSFAVDLHPRLDADSYLLGTLKLKGDFPVAQDLQAGDELTVTVAGLDGEILTSGRLTVGYPAFKEITDKGVVIGTERAHTATKQD